MKNPLYSANIRLSIIFGSNETIFIKLENESGAGYSDFNLQCQSVESFLEQLGMRLQRILSMVIGNMVKNMDLEEKIRNNISKVLKRYKDSVWEIHGYRYKFNRIEDLPQVNGKPEVTITLLHQYSTELLQAFLKEAKRVQPTGIFAPGAPTIDDVAQKHHHEEMKRFEEIIEKIKEELKRRESK